MNYRNQKGFTLIEVIVVAGIIAILAGILVPMIFGQIDEAKITRAKADCATIAKAVQLFKTNTGKWPSFSAGTAPCVAGVATQIDVLMSNSTSSTPPPVDAAANVTGWNMAGNNVFFSSLLRAEDPATASGGANGCYPVPTSQGSVGWKGPYLPSGNEDPWGNAYVIYAADFETNKKVFVLSAGPDGKLQTSTDSSATGDDIAAPIK